jgi:hypothetical protein
MVDVDSTLLAALISAFVAFAIVVFNTNYLEPRRKKIEEQSYRRQLLRAWISDVKTILEALGEKQRRLEHLFIDDRPLDRLGLSHPELVELMTSLRSRILNLNRMVEIYDLVTAPQIERLLVPELESHQMETMLSPQERRDLEQSRRLKQSRDDWLNLVVDKKRETLRSDLESLKRALEKALAKESDSQSAK